MLRVTEIIWFIKGNKQREDVFVSSNFRRRKPWNKLLLMFLKESDYKFQIGRQLFNLLLDVHKKTIATNKSNHSLITIDSNCSF